MLRKPDITASGPAERGGSAPVHERRLGAGCPAADPAGEGTGTGETVDFRRRDMRATNLANLMSAVLTLAVAAQAQTSRGTVTGTVLDPAGAVVVAARVKLTGVDTGVRLSTVSNDTGVYRFDAVDPGAYEL